MLSCFSRVRLFVTLCTAGLQAPLSMGFSRQKYWSGLPSLPAGIPHPEIEPEHPTSPALAAGFFTTSAIWEGPSEGYNPKKKCDCMWSHVINLERSGQHPLTIETQLLLTSDLLGTLDNELYWSLLSPFEATPTVGCFTSGVFINQTLATSVEPCFQWLLMAGVMVNFLEAFLFTCPPYFSVN